MKIDRLDKNAVTSVARTNRLPRLSSEELREAVGTFCYEEKRTPEECGGVTEGCEVLYIVTIECIA